MLNAQNKSRAIRLGLCLKELLRFLQFDLGLGQSLGAWRGVRVNIFKRNLALSLAVLFQVNVASDGKEIRLQGFGANRTVVDPGADERLGSDVFRIETVARQRVGRR